MNFHLIFSLILLLRFLSHFKLQYGYIHPDEFFQTIEISAGDVLNVSVKTPWEFDMPFPIRSKAIIELFLNIPLKMFFHLQNKFSFSIFHSVDILTFFRLWTTACSLIVDYSIYVVCRHNGINFKIALFLHGTSHIAIVFLSRTFSNTWETQLLSLFVIVFHKKNSIITQIIEGLIIAVGIFCRPTFACFVTPFVIIKLLSMHNWRNIGKYAINGLLGLVLATMGLISVDTMLYNVERVNGGHLWSYEYFLEHLVIVPLNFIHYNSNHNNLKQHGIHPFYTHFLANIPMMIGLLFIFVLIAPFVNKRFNSFLFAIGMPLICLSLFPHQEMRFLLPIFPLLIVVIAGVLVHCCRSQSLIKTILVVHVSFSLLSVVFWGHLHEGGVVQAASLIKKHIDSSPMNVCHKIVSYKTFLMPKFFFEFDRSKAYCNNSVDNLMGVSEALFWDDLFNISTTTMMRSTLQSPSVVILHLIYPKAHVFKRKDYFSKLGSLKSSYSIVGHINTDLWPPQVPFLDFLSLQYMSFVL